MAMIIGAYSHACVISLLGLMASFTACILSSKSEIELAMVCLILAGLADLFDGYVARRLKLSEYKQDFGVQIDTIIDVVSFVITPSIIALNFGLNSLRAVCLMYIFVSCGVVRLAHFNTMKRRGSDLSAYYRGLPVTYTALVFPILFITKDYTTSIIFGHVLEIAFASFATLFVINIPVPKPRGIFYVLLPVIATCLMIYWTLLVYRY